MYSMLHKKWAWIQVLREWEGFEFSHAKAPHPLAFPKPIEALGKKLAQTNSRMGDLKARSNVPTPETKNRPLGRTWNSSTST